MVGESGVNGMGASGRLGRELGAHGLSDNRPIEQLSKVQMFCYGGFMQERRGRKEV